MQLECGGAATRWRRSCARSPFAGSLGGRRPSALAPPPCLPAAPPGWRPGVPEAGPGRELSRRARGPALFAQAARTKRPRSAPPDFVTQPRRCEPQLQASGAIREDSRWNSNWSPSSPYSSSSFMPIYSRFQAARIDDRPERRCAQSKRPRQHYQIFKAAMRATGPALVWARTMRAGLAASCPLGSGAGHLWRPPGPDQAPTGQLASWSRPHGSHCWSGAAYRRPASMSGQRGTQNVARYQVGGGVEKVAIIRD